MKQSKMTLIALVIILIGLALCTIHIVYADNQNSKEASSNDLGCNKVLILNKSNTQVKQS